jgi:undecaprenyl-diphosphatase
VVVVVAAGGGAVLIACGQIFGRVAGPALATPPDVAAGSPQPRTRSAALAAGAGLAAAADGLAFAAVLDGVGADVPVLIVAALAILAPLLWSTLPPAGGAGAVELLLLAGLVALGVPIATACAGVLLHRLLTWWLPAAIGALTAPHLQHRLLL